MSTLSELLANRDTAGARYLAAVLELRASYIELASIDRALNNRHVGQPSVVTFRGDFNSVPVDLQHPTYAPGNRGEIVAAVQSASAVILAAFGTPEE